MTSGSARRGVTRAMLALVALCVLSPGWLGSAQAGSSFKIKGQASGLIPGVSRNLVIVIENPYDFAIVVRGVEVISADASDACPAANISSPGITGDVRVKAGAVVKVTVPIRLLSKAPPACEGATFPLSFKATARRT